jgi:two-component system chemotaxis response regulator CheY
MDVRALVVEDAPELRKLIRMVLREMGIKDVEEASDGLEALALIEKGTKAGEEKNRRFDFVLCDIHMPQMDGIGLLQEIRRRETVRDTPVIMISGDNTAEKIVEAVKLGADDFIIKPYTVKIVEQKVRRILEGRTG